ncbi:aminotransferase class I/II-fold pyridoxal phosphate-dependent enzyme [bacterium]|nr:aminotransferase class I/II-fold pyridoxal phosphate-dependent enzyme [bacterium]
MSVSIDKKAYLAGLTKSSKESYQSLKLLLADLENEETRASARVILEELKEKSDEYEFFDFVSIPISGPNGWKSLSLLQLPSTFAPEEWSYTFYEGLNRYPKQRFFNKKVCELGCGNGWISLSVAIKTQAEIVYGVDINPKAIVLSKLNLYLNALDKDGQIKKFEDGASLLDKVVFAESDLLNYFTENSIQLDLITGCIPQVLSPDSDMEFKDVKEELSDEALYDLSNYAPSLGYIEDQFGLGLIAKALEQSIGVLNASGRVVLNLGGRPGQEVLESLFLRRGFTCDKIWQTKVWQADDTDISPLVNIESGSAHRFEFFTSLTSDISVNATVADTYAKKGGHVAHSLCVYEGKLEYPHQTKKVHTFLAHKDFEPAIDNLDLSIKDKHIFEEKIEFLSFLSEYLTKDGTFSYENVKGMVSFREKLSYYFKLYFKLSLSKENMMLFPSRAEFIRSVIFTYDFEKILVSESYFKSEEKNGPKNLLREEGFNKRVFEAPLSVEICTKLIEKIRPDFFITELHAYEHESTVAFERLVLVCKNAGTKLLVDVSTILELNSQPKANGVFRYLADNKMPSHVSIIGSFVRNAVYERLSLCFLMSENQTFLDHLTNAAELNYSRVPVIPQIYYEAILNDLLSFQLSELKITEASNGLVEDDSYQKQLGRNSVKAFDHSAIKSEYRTFKDDSIRLDYGENELGVSVSFKRSVFDAFGKKNIDFSSSRLTESIRRLVNTRYGIAEVGYIHFGLGAASIFSGLAYECSKMSGKFLFPKGNYGMFHAAGVFNRCDLVEIETSEKNDFSVTPSDLNNALKTNKNAWVYLQYPIVNPTGKIVSAEEFNALLKVAKSHGAKVIVDTIFSGLESNSSSVDTSALDLINETGKDSVDVFLIGGPSKEFAAGGLRVGFLWTNSNHYYQNLSANITVPHITSLAVYQDLLVQFESEDSDLITKLEEQRLTLKKHAKKLETVLSENGWTTIYPEGGLFLVAKPPQNLHGKPVSDLLFEQANVSINSDEWTGLNNYYRFVLSVEESVFSEALKRLKKALPNLK